MLISFVLHVKNSGDRTYCNFRPKIYVYAIEKHEPNLLISDSEVLSGIFHILFLQAKGKLLHELICIWLTSNMKGLCDVILNLETLKLPFHQQIKWPEGIFFPICT